MQGGRADRRRVALDPGEVEAVAAHPWGVELTGADLPGHLTGDLRRQRELHRAGIDLDRVTDKLLADGVEAFSRSFEKLLAGIEKKKSRLSEKRQPASIGSGEQKKLLPGG